jgi:Tol biopolymer transport system component
MKSRMLRASWPTVVAGVRISALVACIAGCAAVAALASSASAAYPGSNGKIIFERKADQFAPASDPWTVSAGNPGSARKLVKIREDAYNFVYSPNGRKVAFEANVPSQEIVVMKASGKKPKVITKKVKKCIGKSNPTWSPNGKKIAFTCLNSKGFNQHDVWSVNADGRGIRQLSSTHDAYDPAWSPRGDKIAYTSYGGAIYTLPAGGGTSSLLSEEAPGGVFGGTWERIDWSPDGQTLVADSSGDGVYTLSATTGAPSAKLANGGSEPVFSPDGTKILYVGVAESSGVHLDLWMMDVNGGAKQQVTQGGYDRAPNWAPAR